MTKRIACLELGERVLDGLELVLVSGLARRRQSERCHVLQDPVQAGRVRPAAGGDLGDEL
jgi:hypothetical protein